MNKLIIPQLDITAPTAENVSAALDEKVQQTAIDNVNWRDYPYKPDVTFAMAYDERHLFLKYYVREKHIRAMETSTNGSVWEDSCCEFFCSFNNDGYYNLETNCIGTQLLGYGRSKTERYHLPKELINEIQKVSTLGEKTIESGSGDFQYQLTIAITVSTFQENPELTFKSGMQFRANFYKCGDKTPEPHFISWNPIKIENPDFHRPDFFGVIELA